MYKNLAAAPVAACFIAPAFFRPSASRISAKGVAGPVAGALSGLLPSAQNGLTR